MKKESDLNEGDFISEDTSGKNNETNKSGDEIKGELFNERDQLGHARGRSKPEDSRVIIDRINNLEIQQIYEKYIEAVSVGVRELVPFINKIETICKKVENYKDKILVERKDLFQKIKNDAFIKSYEDIKDKVGKGEISVESADDKVNDDLLTNFNRIKDVLINARTVKKEFENISSVFFEPDADPDNEEYRSRVNNLKQEISKISSISTAIQSVAQLKFRLEAERKILSDNQALIKESFPQDEVSENISQLVQLEETINKIYSLLRDVGKRCGVEYFEIHPGAKTDVNTMTAGSDSSALSMKDYLLRRAYIPEGIVSVRSFGYREAERNKIAPSEIPIIHPMDG